METCTNLFNSLDYKLSQSQKIKSKPAKFINQTSKSYKSNQSCSPQIKFIKNS